jgi:hypothetical protein
MWAAKWCSSEPLCASSYSLLRGKAAHMASSSQQWCDQVLLFMDECIVSRCKHMRLTLETIQLCVPAVFEDPLGAILLADGRFAVTQHATWEEWLPKTPTPEAAGDHQEGDAKEGV